MTKTIKQTEKDFKELMQKMSSYEQALGLLQWDARTKAPKKGADQRSEVIGSLSTELFKLKTSEETGGLLEEILQADKDVVSNVTRQSAKELKKEYDRSIKIPEDEFREYSILTAKSESIWEEAKEQNDFEMFRPYLEKIVRFSRKFADYWGYEGHPYNALLEDFDPGMTVDTLDQVFSRLRDGLIPLVEGVTSSSNKPQTDFIFRSFPKDNQKQFSSEILSQMTYDFEAGRLDETVHPFAIGLNPKDVRVTTKYDENDFRTAVFGTIHEGGHALYEQNLPEELAGTVLSDGTSMGIHESQSLFWENFVGRNKMFWENNYDLLQSYSNGQFEDVNLDQFYHAINEAKPSLIRIEADEMTYSLHIILRYEIEKGLINGDIEVADLPKVWNEKMEEYLGVIPPNDSQGVLQDVHWSFGAFGYFPSYALGYIYAAQLHQAMRKEIPEFDQLCQKGELSSIREWLTKHVHQYGRIKSPAEIIKDATGENINPEHLLNYLSEKYKPLYQF
ncbi:carboxypeptidase Taq [Salibacterium salarium]|uniref:carboxypeptidase M32 n=1 Tax=Salibacterium salarium TaxID=284579 RepID=UPI002783E14C|nr:carboxypeptidase M32 [Salibacterium salarium]MDQ0299270.1 carboxypeptidase Taq [Salibacterium salarium]